MALVRQSRITGLCGPNCFLLFVMSLTEGLKQVSIAVKYLSVSWTTLGHPPVWFEVWAAPASWWHHLHPPQRDASATNIRVNESASFQRSVVSRKIYMNNNSESFWHTTCLYDGRTRKCSVDGKNLLVFHICLHVWYEATPFTCPCRLTYIGQKSYLLALTLIKSHIYWLYSTVAKSLLLFSFILFPHLNLKALTAVSG